jgi:adenylate cyclase
MEPKILIPYLNSILHRVSDCILATGGTVDKFMGDGIMAFWNAPIDEPEHARRALETIAAIMQAQVVLNADFERRALPGVRLGVGVNTGPCNVGLIGSEKRLDYSCIGDPVNYASRLEGMTKAYGAFNCIGEATARQARGWPVAALDRVAARGRQAVEAVYLALDGNDPDGAARIIATIDAARDNPGDAQALAALEALETPFLNGMRLASYYRTRRSEAA